MPASDDRIPVLLNPFAGGPRGVGRRQIESALAERGVRADVREYAPDAVAGAVAELRRSGARIVAVAGGDGTVRTAAERLAGGETALAVLPTGTLNHFARRVGIEDLEAAAEALAMGSSMRVAVGVADDRLFLNTATFGQYAAVVRRRERLRARLGKWPAAAVAFGRTLRRLHPISLAIDLPEGRIERTSPMLWVGVGRGTFPRATGGEQLPSADRLEVVIARVRSRWTGFALLVRLFLRALRERPAADDRAIEVLHTRALLLREPRRIEATLDGEVVAFNAPVAVGLLEGALRVVVRADDRHADGESGRSRRSSA